MVIDIFFQILLVIVIKEQKGESVAEVFNQLLKERVPKFLWTDKEKMFYNKNVEEILKQYSNKIIFNEEKKFSC